MADVFNKKKRSLVMAAIKSVKNKDTELALIKIFRKYRIMGWRRNYPIIGKPDFVFTNAKLAIFVDGCFWHQCPDHGRVPKSNIEYWEKKLQNNIVRDAAVVKNLTPKGWTVLRIWEHELRDGEAVSRRILVNLDRQP